MDRLFLDANVLFTAAHRPAGKAAWLFQPQRPVRWQLLSSAYALEEARRNLARKAPAAQDALAVLRQALTVVAQPSAPAVALELPPKDQPIWAAALAARATHLLTGDLRDFGLHMNRPTLSAGVWIQTVGDYLSSL